MSERLTAAQRAILRRLADDQPGREGLGDGLFLCLRGLTKIDGEGAMRITPAGRRALEEDGGAG